MSVLHQALQLAAQGFHVFPCRENGKLPCIRDYPNRASRDPQQIRKWFDGRPRNIGISTTKFGDDLALIVIDVDNKKGKNGDATILQLELEGHEFPPTFEQTTPSGGRHIVYVSDEPLRQGTDVLGSGADIRSKGGYILGPGSSIDGAQYTVVSGPETMGRAPAWLCLRLGADRGDRRSRGGAVDGVDAGRAVDRGMAWLTTQPGAPEGSRGSTAYRMAARLRDLGCTLEQALYLLDMEWAGRCDPPMPSDDLEASVEHAYRYARDAQGCAAPEAVFPQREPEDDPTPDADDMHPFDQVNAEFAFIKRGGFVLQETTDEKGLYCTEHLSLAEFHAWFANRPFQSGERWSTVSKEWMKWASRRQFDGVVFSPERNPGARFYNLWRGFSTSPADSGSHPAVELFKEHALFNVCNGDKALYRWLMGYFAHMIQRPWEKPLVALVFKGAKGVGKNALVERVGALLGPHFLVADDDRYLLGNFNSHLEANLCFVLDEAAWAGDKRAEGKLKGLITGARHNIERKGQEPYRVDNLTRVVVLGNEDWLVPASVDERRFAVFNVGDGRKQDRKFFIDMRVGMEQGGYAHLLRFFQEFDLSTVDVNEAPNTSALIEQKHASLDDLGAWWLDCLTNGHICGGDWGGEWPASTPANRLRDAFARWAKGRNIRSRLVTDQAFGRAMVRMAPCYTKKRTAVTDDQSTDSSYAYHHPGLDRLRTDWERYIGGKVEWPT